MRHSWKQRALSAAIGVALAAMPGCEAKQTGTASSEPAESHEAHIHGHDHGHQDEGPNGGHLIELAGGQYRAEWLHDDDTGKITMIFLDSAAKKEVSIPANQVQVEVIVAGQQPAIYSLSAVSVPDAKTEESSRFEIVDSTLLVALKLGEGVEATLLADVDGQQLRGRIEHHEHDHHGHQH